MIQTGKANLKIQKDPYDSKGYTHAHTCFLFSFMSSCLHVWSSHPLFRLHAHGSRPWCVRAPPSSTRFQVAQVFTIMRRVFIGCSCALGSLSSQPHTHTPLSRLVPFSCLHSCVLLRAHLHFRSGLSASRLPSGRRVCATPSTSDCLPVFVRFFASFSSTPSFSPCFHLSGGRACVCV